MKKFNFVYASALIQCFSAMVQKDKHGLSYELNFNIFKLRSIISESLEIFKEAGKTLKGEELKQLEDKFNKEIFEFKLKSLDEKVLKKLIEDKVFDGINLTILFETGYLK
tara:strand:- start:18663 stop:18992 length:330 start_codon:yes stop_codon:yes gene_type:complete